MSESLKIIIFDGTFKTTPFVRRLLEGLVQQHNVYVLGVNETLKHPVNGVNYVALGSNQSKIRFIKTTLRYLIKMKNVNIVFSTLKKLILGQRQKLQQQNLNFLINQINPDVIHLQWPSALPLFEEELIKQNWPVVLSQRGYHSNVRPFVDTDNLKYLQNWYPKIAGFHSVSHAISKKGDEIYKSESKINRVIYTGHDLRELPFVETYEKPKTLKLLSVGRPHWIKNYTDVLYAIQQLNTHNLPFEYTIIGGEANEELQYLIHDLKLEQNVKLTPRVSQDDVYAIMEDSSLLLMSSLAEGVPNIVVEAMAIGLPVLSTKCGGVEELIMHKKTGFLIPKRDKKAITSGILEFNNLDNKEINNLRIKARAKVLNQHTEEKMVSGMLELYKASMI